MEESAKWNIYPTRDHAWCIQNVRYGGFMSIDGTGADNWAYITGKCLEWEAMVPVILNEIEDIDIVYGAI